jgi:hypothetical protein
VQAFWKTISMASSQHKSTDRPYNPSIYFLDLIITRGDHDPLSRKLELHLPPSYTPADARAILAHSTQQLRTHPIRTFTPLPIHHHTTLSTLHVDLTTDVLSLNNLQDDTTLSFLPRNGTVPDLLPCLRGAQRLAFPWTPSTFTVHCPRCGARSLCKDTTVCPRSTNRCPHRWEQVIPGDLLALWPRQFPDLERVYVVVDTEKYAKVMRLREEMVAEVGELTWKFGTVRRGVCYDFDEEGDEVGVGEGGWGARAGVGC